MIQRRKPCTNLHAVFANQRTSTDEFHYDASAVFYGYALNDQLPGDPVEVNLINFHVPRSTGGGGVYDRNSYNKVHNDTIEVHDAFYGNCSLREEIVCFAFDEERERYQLIGQHGLLRRVAVDQEDPIQPGATGKGRLRDGQTSNLQLDLKNTTDEPLVQDDVVWACWIANIGDDTYDNTGVAGNEPPDPVPIRDGEWQTISSGVGEINKFVRLEGSLGAAVHGPGIVTPTSISGLVVWEWAGGTIVPDTTPPIETITAWNVLDEELDAGFYRVNKFGDNWVIDVSKGGSSIRFAKLTEVLDRPEYDEEADEFIPASASTVQIYNYENGRYFGDGEGTVINTVENMTFCGMVPVVSLGEGVYSVIGQRIKGDILCRLDTPGNTDKVMISDTQPLPCTWFHRFGPDYPDQEQGQSSDVVTVANPHALVGWKNLHCKWNYTEERYEVIGTNLEQGAAWPCRLVFNSGSEGSSSERCDFSYYATDIHDTGRQYPGGPFQPNNANEEHPYGDFRPDLGKLEQAKYGLIYYDTDDDEFRLYDAREKWCVSVLNQGAAAQAGSSVQFAIPSRSFGRFNGSNSSADYGNPPELQITEKLTVGFRARTWDAVASTISFVAKFDTTGNQRSWYVLSASANPGKVRFIISDDGSSTDYVDSETNIISSTADGTWYHVVCVYDGTTIKIYINGVVDGQDTTSLASLYNSSASLTVGERSGANYLDGDLYDLKVYSRALEAFEIYDWYRGQAPDSKDLEIDLPLGDSTADVHDSTDPVFISSEADITFLTEQA